MVTFLSPSGSGAVKSIENCPKLGLGKRLIMSGYSLFNVTDNLHYRRKAYSVQVICYSCRYFISTGVC